MARQVQTVLVSMLLHIAGVFAIVVIPLLALDGLPGVPSMTRYVPVELKTPETPPAPRVRVASTETPVAPSAPPAEAPRNVIPERPERLPSITSTPGIDGAVGIPGIGAHPDVIAVVTPPPPPADPVRPGGLVKFPSRVTYVPPVYPPIAVTARVSGTVIIEAVIDVDGSVRDARVLRSIPLLDESALAAVRQWRYTPTTLNGIAVPVIMTVSVRFEIGGSAIECSIESPSPARRSGSGLSRRTRTDST
jgi:protein TonB